MTSDPGRSRAVLFGVHDFRDLPRLDGVRHNAPALRELLTSDEIGGLADEDCTVVPHDGTQQQLLDALHDAAQEATDLLLVYYAGHGHFGGRDRQFLLATGNSSGQRPYHSVKYSDIRDLVAGSAAQRKVVVIDCCFSGRALSMADEQTPTQLDTEITGACVLTSAAETERSLCLPDGSVFTLELTKLLSEGLSGELTGGRQGEHLPELTMTDVFNALHTRLHGRTVDGLRVPQPRMSTRDLGHQIVLARNRAYTGPPTDGPESASEEHPWVAATRDHPLWNYVTDERGLLSLRETATALVARAAAASEDDGEALGGDPWHSPAFTDRVAEWTDSLLLDSSLRPDELELSAAEVFLLVTHPYLHAAFWRQNASRYASISPTVLAEAQSTAPARRSYDLFLRNHPRLVRRALRSSDPRAAEAIGWWLFHRWLVLEPRLYDPAAAETLLDRLAVPLGERSPRERRLVEDVLDPRLVSRLLRAPQLTGPSERDDGMPRSVGVAETAQRVRAHQLAELLRIAHLFAVDPVALPEVLVDHVGIGYAVDLPELHSTLDRLRWEANGRTRVLGALCHHLAVELGLRQHAGTLDTLLARIDIRSGDGERPALLRNLPLHATAEQVTPAADASGRWAYESTELRFRLADDRIQELLMGEQLYGDPALAIRELYQNALDACRYRRARTEYLGVTRGQRMPYQGTITFSQGVDEKGPYLECRDNGIGMGEAELRDVFSHAGMSFADMPEYIEEKARWEEHGVSMHPNSQFGVGVLSYFMLADDITVTTCRLTPDGLPGEHLRVEIAGPGSLFRIQRLERCPDAYTSVRLRLRSSDVTSCVDVLRRILWISECAVTASDGQGEKEVWRPNVLGGSAPLGAADPHDPSAGRTPDAVVVGTSTPAVWWCSTRGAILADGLWAGEHRFGAVVNLSGKHTPRLTVDRRRIIEADTAETERLLRQEIPSLLAAGDAVFRHGWLAYMLEESPELADAIFAEAVRTGFTPWRIAGREVDIRKCGYYPPDDVMNGSLRSSGWVNPVWPAISSFRMEALTDAGFFPGFVVAKPSDRALPVPSDIYALMPQWNTNRPDPARREPAMSWDLRVNLRLVNRAARRTGWSFQKVVDRLERLGFSAPTASVTRLEPDDLRIVGDLELGDPVHPARILQAAAQTGRAPQHIVSHLAELGYRVAPGPVPRPEPHDVLILSQDLDGQEPWLDVDRQVSIAHLVRAAYATRLSADKIAARLREFGLSVPTTRVPSLESDDFRILSENATGIRPWIDPARPVHPAHVILAAATTGHSADHVVSRLTELGHRVSALPVPLHEPGDLRILSKHGRETAPWIDLDAEVHPVQILRAAWVAGRPVDHVTSRLAQFGFRIAPMPRPEPDDAHILSRDLDGEPPWIDYDRPVNPPHILRAAEATNRSPRAVLARLEELGLRLHDAVALSP
ncbi:caspase family protein [Streptomyces sp. Go40/10]|uniref:caspase, EACC1-associated type n=1 Tax=Streptomyces sp. Go40/10 TaxID=2825844 RepID=UPI001E323303|nr:caspase family protein [Streptomyces sp. Go40/10]UFR01752.1 caspase family protein [Streptomyces sp. Go40/10]